jgi:hypothetical protein
VRTFGRDQVMAFLIVDKLFGGKSARRFGKAAKRLK